MSYIERKNANIYRYNFVDLLKAIGSIVICLHHYLWNMMVYVIPESGGEGVFSSLNILSSYGMLMTELFFILSGFTAMCSSESTASCENVLIYLSKKIRKIYPAIFLSTIACLVLQAISFIHTGHMVLGFEGYHAFDIISNFMLVQSGIFSMRSMLNVPLWFITPLLVCNILFYLVKKYIKQNYYILFICFVIIGGICVYYGYSYPIFNIQMGRGLFSFFLGVCVHMVISFSKRMSNVAKLLWGGGAAECFYLVYMGYAGDTHLTTAIGFAMLIIFILETPIIEIIISCNTVRKLYQPFYLLSMDLFCTHFVVLTGIVVIDLFFPISQFFHTYKLLGIYLILSYCLSICSRKFSNRLFGRLISEGDAIDVKGSE